jgi:hypothetical protein
VRYVKFAFLLGCSVACLCSVPSYGTPPATNEPDTEKRWEDWNKLTPEQKQTMQKEWRDQFEKLTPEKRQAKRKELKARLEKRVNELRQRGTNGTLTAEEKRELGRREQILKRFEKDLASHEETK